MWIKYHTLKNDLHSGLSTNSASELGLLRQYVEYSWNSEL